MSGGSPNEALAASLIALAAEFAADPAKGKRAGYTPEQKYLPGEPTGTLDAGPSIETRDPQTAWLYGIARRRLRAGTYTILDGGEGEAELVIF